MSNSAYSPEYYASRHDAFLRKNLNKIPAFKAIKDFIEVKDQEVILEAGCGIGYVLHYVCKDSRAIGNGIDIIDHAIERGKALFPHYHFSCQDVTATNFPDNTFDKIFSFHVIEHVQDYEKMLIEMHRILKPGGIFIVGTEMLEALNTKIFNLLIGDPTHVKEFYKQELLDEVGKYFKIIDFKKASAVGRFSFPISTFFHLFLKGEIIIKATKN